MLKSNSTLNSKRYKCTVQKTKNKLNQNHNIYNTTRCFNKKGTLFLSLIQSNDNNKSAQNF